MKKLVLFPMLAMLASCSTMNQSFQLGAGMGAASGIAAVYSGSIGQEHGPVARSYNGSARFHFC